MMHKTSIDFAQTGYFGKLFLDLIANKNELQKFQNNTQEFDIENFNIDFDKRKALFEVIEEQNQRLNLSSKTKFNVNLLKEEKTFTVCTGHQLNLLGGPLFFAYKILSTIKAAEEFAQKHPNYNFVPIYWMASEDHDFAEINHFYLFGKKYEWLKDVQNQTVGSLDLTGIQDILAQTKDLPQNILDCYLSSKTLAEAHQRLVNELFGEYGIVILDPNHPKLKKSFLEFFNKEIDAQISYNHVTKTNQELENLGYKTQVSPRACNLFYQENGKRFRIEVTQNEIVLVDSGLKYSLADFKNKVAQNPELISQNVITRPIYQQQILPNIAYIGGPGELAYWLQLKSLFDSQNLAYPMLVSRFSALYLPSYLIDKMQKANLSIEKIFTPFDVLKQEIMSQDTGGEQIISQLNIGYDNYKNDICKNLESQQNLSLLTYAQSTLTRIEKEHQNIVKKVKKEIESRNSVQIERTKGVLDALFPNNELQERTECVFSFLINNSNFLDDLYHLINPFEYKFQILQS